MKLISWNVNGIRSVANKGFLEFITSENPDILCVQETKAHSTQVDLALPQYPHHVWNSAQKKGYSGTAIFSKSAPMSVTYDFDDKTHCGEGRIITAEFKDYFLINCYTPNAQRGLTRLDYRMQWDTAFLTYLTKLEKKKPIIFCGDLNVAHKEIDLANPKQNVKNAGFTPEERAGFDRLVAHGFIDTFREFTTSGGYYSWWSYMFNARAKNIGWRIDYFCISTSLRQSLKEAFICCDVMGSDHCPVGIVLK